jgi:hypothetical protein
MKIPNSVHTDLARSRNWCVTPLAADFQLLDVWRFPIRAGTDVPLLDFLELMMGVQQELISGSGIAGALFRLRRRLGRVLGWDDAGFANAPPQSIPGCSETSLRDRLPPDAVRDAPAARAGGGIPGFDPVYRSEEECLLEISNATVHALMHFGREPVSDARWAPLMAVYVKPRGRRGHLYMTLIGPFRHWFVYPAMLRAASQKWQETLAC